MYLLFLALSMAKRELPTQAFQDILNVYVSNGWFPWKHKIVKNDALDKLVVVTDDGKITFTAHHYENPEMTVPCCYSVADLFSLESSLHDYVNWKVRGYTWQRDGQPPIHDVGYGYQYMNMATMTIGQKMEYFLQMTDLT